MITQSEAHGSYYVSRSRHFYSGSFAGEMLLERQLEKVGFQILYPEEMPLAELVGKLASADRIIFAEGSAIHNLELCRKTSAKIFLVARRGGGATSFVTIISEYCSDWRVFSNVFPLGSLEWDSAKEGMHGPKSISLLDIRALLMSISDFFEIVLDLPTEDECQMAILASLGQYIIDDRTTRASTTSEQQLGLMLTNMREAFSRYRDSRVAGDIPAKRVELPEISNIADTEKTTVSQTMPMRYVLQGMNYYRFLAQFHEKHNPQSYLEIGVNKGKSIATVNCATVGVDPQFVIDGTEVVGKKPFLFLAQMTSDAFFEKFDLSTFFPGGTDMAFLDGMHQFEYLLRDFINAEKFVNNNSVYFLHDCLPINYEMAERVRNRGGRIDQEYGGHWTGDVWKLYPILREYRPDLEIVVLDCPPTGLVVIKNMDPKNTVLMDHYDEIVSRYIDIPFGENELAALRASIQVVSAGEYLATVFPAEHAS